MLAPLLLAALVAAPSLPFRAVEPGLEVAVFDAPKPSTHGDSKIWALRIDPTVRRLRFYSNKYSGLAQNKTAEEWGELFGLSAVINAGMFSLEDQRSPVGYAQLDGKVLNPRWNPRAIHKAVLVFDPKEKGLAPVRILDFECDDVKAIVPKYRNALQSIRMIDCRGKNRWDQKARKWSAAFVGLDGAGRVLFVHSRSPWTPSAFIDLLLAMPLGLKQAIYMEGGPEASLVLRSKAESWSRIGSYETDFNENDRNDRLWPIPNVFGVERLDLPPAP